MLQIILLIVGFILLIKGADVFVESASTIALKFHVPEIVIGLTVVAFGTSAPEAAVSITSAYKGTTGIAIGNILGSNIANVLLILGVSGLVGKLSVKKNTFFFEIPFVILVTILLLTLGSIGQELSVFDGGILGIFFIIFFIYLYKMAKSEQEELTAEQQTPLTSWGKLIFYLLLSLVCIVVGSQVTIDAASEIAKTFGMSERVIGLTIVAIGTSLPELATSLMASLKGKNDIAVGNIVGSNIFNILFVLSASSLLALQPLTFSSSFIFDGIIAIIAIVMFMVFVDKQMTLKKYGALIMILSYLFYIGSLF